MFRRSTVLFSLFLFACPAEPQSDDDDTTTPDTGVIDPKDGGMNPPDAGDPGFGESELANLRYKEVLRLTNDFAQAMEISPNEVCLELGQYDCRGVHNIALGGVEPYELGLVEPTPETTITTPIAVERLSVHACERRVTLDLGNSGAKIFAGIADGEIANVDDPAVAAAIDQLYKHAVQRPATESEVGHLKQLYRDVAALGGTNPARDWAIASCVAVLTSVETLFY